ncbi:DnaD domain-containing protein [Paenibacillus macerans]|uniref:DnaD domain-containing protein n=1 Tax=Paenibacillus macerans TaxID=44252 RepID=UPI000EEDD602|nr:DnaD domain-containing protein [Paenibacillus macerans]MEC0328247.1 DnaD domain-containing protein [Paenibacillus macerans]GBK63221.1 DNA replication protein DnaD [Paenibacillus macerans]GBK69534.1 DNA replication protein DnaD [Paenibacillus macerans]
MADSKKSLMKGIALGMRSGSVTVPYPLLVHYRDLHLSDTEAMLLIQLLAFQQAEQNDFPSMEQLERRLDIAPGGLAAVLRRLLKEGWISIDETVDEITGVQAERYNLSGMYERLGQFLAERQSSLERDLLRGELGAEPPEGQERNLFVIFEKEFARPLSPMECETISGWVDQDQYPEELILLALKEAVFAGKVHFRYIDRILLEWSRNRVRTAEDARAYTQRFRGGMR